MNRRLWLWVAGIVGLGVVIYLALAVFGVQAAFIDNKVDEDFPASAAQVPTLAPTAPVATAEPGQPTPTEAPTAIPATSAPTGPQQVLAGEFHGVSHDGAGRAQVFQQPDGSYVLRFEDLNVDNGPDLYVYLVAAADASDADSVSAAGFINVAQLKGNQGNQNYPLPAEFDPAVHRAVAIWCQRFGVNFATAPLQ